MVRARALRGRINIRLRVLEQEKLVIDAKDHRRDGVVTFNIGINDLGQTDGSYEDGICGGAEKERCLRAFVEAVEGNHRSAWKGVFSEVRGSKRSRLLTSTHVVRGRVALIGVKGLTIPTRYRTGAMTVGACR